MAGSPVLPDPVLSDPVPPDPVLQDPVLQDPVLPDAVVQVCEHWCRVIDDLAPGLVTGLYLRGGIAFGEWWPGRSDVDFVAVLTRRPSDGDLDPVAWHELALGGVTVRGPSLVPGAVWTDPVRLADHTRHNLQTYWRGTAEALALLPSEGEPEDACCWCVLGVARLHHLLVTGEMTTKSGAGRWGLTYYPQPFHRVLTEALRVREGGPTSYDGEPAARGLDTAAFVAHVVETVGGED